MAQSPITSLSWKRFSLRSFLIVVTLIAIWIGFESQRAQNQRQAVAELRKLSVQISYNWQHGNGDWVGVSAGGSPPGPEWLRDAIGEDYFVTVVRVNCEQTQVHDSDLQWLESLPRVHFVSLFDTPVTNAGMKYVGALPELEILYFFDTQIGDEGLNYITRSVTLREIQCGRTPITNKGLANLSGLHHLEKLWLRGTKVSDAGLEHLRNLTNLVYLDLRDTSVSQHGVARLQESLPKCKIVR